MEYAERDGARHGIERHWAPDGSLEFETCYVAGLEHGTGSQWDHGRLLGTYQMDHGSGVDLWRDRGGALLEERQYRDGHRDGFERWWTGDNQTIRQEGHFRSDVDHGIFRKWNSGGRLRRGYPQYFVNGQRVTKRHYLTMSASDPSLPPIRDADNNPHRDLPVEYSKQPSGS